MKRIRTLPQARAYIASLEVDRNGYHARTVEMERQRNRLDEETKRNATVIADLRSTVARKDEIIQTKNETITALQGERDRILRVVDQLTSVSITSLGGTTSEPRALRNENLRLQK